MKRFVVGCLVALLLAIAVPNPEVKAYYDYTDICLVWDWVGWEEAVNFWQFQVDPWGFWQHQHDVIEGMEIWISNRPNGFTQEEFDAYYMSLWLDKLNWLCSAT